MAALIRRDLFKFSYAGILSAAGLPVSGVAARTNTESSPFFNVRNFGAKGDGLHIDSVAINKAIQAASAAGGGTVYFPAGTYASYSIRLQSRLRLLLDAGATILSAPVPLEGIRTGGYDAAESNAPFEAYQDYGHNHWHNSLIWGEDLSDVTIEGSGCICGKFLSRGGKGKSPRNAGLPKAEEPGVANKSIALKNCRGVTLRDFSILQGGHIAILTTAVDNLTIDNLKIDTNRDGVNVDCCRNVRISNCSINSPWDDGICLKSSFSLGYPRATENVTISNCYVTGTYEIGSLLDGSFRKLSLAPLEVPTGRIKLGTTSAGGFLNIAVTNCVFDTCRGISIENVDGGRVEDIVISGITMRNITTSPLFLRLGARLEVPSGAVPGTLKRISLSNIVSYNSASSYCAFLSGIHGHPIEDIKISNIYLHHVGGGTAEQAKLTPPELESGYPELRNFGPSPAHGFFMRHVRNIELDHVEIAYGNPDSRYAFCLEDVDGADFFRLKTPSNSHSPIFSFRESQNISINASRGLSDSIFGSAVPAIFP